MALSEDDKKETLELMSDAIALGFKKWRSGEEEDEAKRLAEQGNDDKGKKDDKGGNSNGGTSTGFSLQSFILGRSS